ncbi:MAG: immunity 53 family protein [Pirellulales bacterium]|nr:immunity 53 family protein [Pirellulales bacterium]
MDLLVALQEWYASQCDGEWEHRYGVKIESCDNPGWWVKIDLMGTVLQSRSFTPLAENVDAQGFQKDPKWLHCYVDDGVWNGAGDETKLPLILRSFLTWVASHAAQ